MSRPLARLTKSIFALAITASLTIATAIASAEPRRLKPHDRTGDSELSRGQAYMGWSERSKQSTSTAARAIAPAALTIPTGMWGIDVSSWQGNVNWSTWTSRGMDFAYVKATEGTGYRNPYFSSQYGGSYRAGLIRGAYHFALPNRSSGIAQAAYFATNGGGWSRDGKTLPGVLDIEYNPYGATCYSMTKTQMVAWITAFVTEYKRRTSRDAVIYTTYGWWNQCTGNTTKFSRTNPLWVARYASSPGTLPGGWPYYTFWQYSNDPIDQNRFSADKSRLTALALG